MYQFFGQALNRLCFDLMLNDMIASDKNYMIDKENFTECPEYC